MQKNKKIMVGAVAFVVLLTIGAVGFMRAERFQATKGTWERFNNEEQREGGRENRDDMGMMDGDHGGMMGGGNMMNNGSISERKFIEEMIPHHQEAIDTANLLVTKGDNPEMKKLAQSIVDGQQKQINDMKTWYKNWYGVDYKDDGTYKPMMRSNLASLSGTALDRAFLEDMINHHMGALMMGQTVVPNLQHQELVDLVKNIAETQSSEVITMRILQKQI
jgi:uncharacterized protein (DUF305 family)